MEKAQWVHSTTKEKDQPQIIIVIKFQNTREKTKILKSSTEGK